MDVKMLDWKNHVDPDTGCLCRYVQSQSGTEYFRAHYHNYYELFLVMRGTIRHSINGREQFLYPGQLLFIRDFDVHDHKSADGGPFEFLNLAVTRDTLFSLFQYLGEGFPSEQLLQAPFPPQVNLTAREKEKLFFAFTELNQGQEKSLVKLKARTLLVTIFTKYFMNYDQKDPDVPLWLEITYEKMKDPRNFTAGSERIYQLAGKSREHLSRCLKRYFGATPTELVNDLRLNYASNLLLTSKLTVTDICFECGFENLSWFYKMFVQKFGTTPSKYRKKFEIE